MKKQIPPPSNWQDFEDVCKRIFGELWNCKYTIKKHGRNGQEQCGVDVYGFPDGGTVLFGVQCKGKDNQLGKGLTIKEIDKEITNATLFEPKLGSFFFATTAPKDAKIEKYILKKNIESVQNGSFQIGLYDWDDLADEIRRNKTLYNSYISGQHFEEQHEVSLDINGESSNLVVKPKFLKERKTYLTGGLANIAETMSNMSSPFAHLMKSVNISPFHSNKVNHSWCKIKTTILNTGNVALDDYKLWLTVDSNLRKIDNDEPKGINAISYDYGKFHTTSVYQDENKILYSPLNKTIIPKDKRSFTWYFLPKHDAKETIIRWQLLSRNYDTEGELKIKLEPEFELKNEYIKVDIKSDERIDEEILDLVKEVDNSKDVWGI